MPLVKLSNGNSLYFAHVPKTGGSSIDDYLKRRFGKLGLHVPLPLPKSRGIIIGPQHLAAQDIMGILPLDVSHSFAVVRDPFKRLKSQYRFQQAYSRASKMSFSTWLRMMLAAARRDPRAYNNHIRPQSDIVPDDAKVFRLEDGLDQIVTWLDQIDGQATPDIQIQHIGKSKTVPAVHSRQDLELAKAFYAKDYERFGYTPTADDDAPNDTWHGLRGAGAALVAPAIIARQRRRWLA